MPCPERAMVDKIQPIIEQEKWPIAKFVWPEPSCAANFPQEISAACSKLSAKFEELLVTELEQLRGRLVMELASGKAALTCRVPFVLESVPV